MADDIRLNTDLASALEEAETRYRAANPMVRVQLFDTLAEQGLELLRSGAVDLAITAGGDLREFDLEELKRERFYLVCPKAHALASKRSVSLPQLAGQEIVHLARSSSVRQCLEAALPAPLGQPRSLEVEHLATVAALVAQGLGVAIVPELTLFHFHRAGLAAVPERDKQLTRPIYLARRKGKALSVAAKAMVDEIVREAGAATATSLPK